jgi:hypothetical protein
MLLFFQVEVNASTILQHLPLDETTSTTLNEFSIEPAPKKKPTRRKTKQTDSSTSDAPLETNITFAHVVEQTTLDETATQPETPKKPSRRVGQRQPKRDSVGQQ